MNLSSLLLSFLLTVGLPTSVDNSTSKYFPPVISQTGGSCAQASYIGYMYTYEWNRLADTDASESPEHRFSYLYTWNFINDGENVGSFGFDALQLCMQNGVMSEADFPSQVSYSVFKWASGYDLYYRAMHNRILNFSPQNLKTEEDLQKMKAYLYNHWEEGAAGGVFTFSTNAADWVIDNNYSGPSETGYKSLLKRMATTGGHALTIVGYDDLVEFTSPDGTLTHGAFIVCNTWGSAYHDNGRFYLPYWFFLNNNEDCGYYLSEDVYVLDVAIQQPQLTFKVKVDCDKRNNLCFSIGAAEGLTSDTPKLNYKVGIANHMGGPYNMQGARSNSFIEMGFDFSSAVKFVGEYEQMKFFLTVHRQKKDGAEARFAKLLEFAVLDYRNDPEHPTVYTYAVPEGGEEINTGDNIFTLTTAEPPVVSASLAEWLTKNGVPVTSPIIFRTADGKYAKVRFLDYDRQNGDLSFKYVYSPSGDTNLE